LLELWLCGVVSLVFALVSGCSGTSIPQIDRPTAEGAVIGTLAGSYLTALLALGQGIGNGQNTAPLIPAGAALGALAGAGIGHWIGQNYSSPRLVEPTDVASLGPGGRLNRHGQLELSPGAPQIEARERA